MEKYLIIINKQTNVYLNSELGEFIIHNEVIPNGLLYFEYTN